MSKINQEELEEYTEDEIRLLDEFGALSQGTLDDDNIYLLMLKYNNNYDKIKKEICEVRDKIQKRGGEYLWSNVENGKVKKEGSLAEGKKLGQKGKKKYRGTKTKTDKPGVSSNNGYNENKGYPKKGKKNTNKNDDYNDYDYPDLDYADFKDYSDYKEEKFEEDYDTIERSEAYNKYNYTSKEPTKKETSTGDATTTETGKKNYSSYKNNYYNKTKNYSKGYTSYNSTKPKRNNNYYPKTKGTQGHVRIVEVDDNPTVTILAEDNQRETEYQSYRQIYPTQTRKKENTEQLETGFPSKPKGIYTDYNQILKSQDQHREKTIEKDLKHIVDFDQQITDGNGEVDKFFSSNYDQMESKDNQVSQIKSNLAFISSQENSFNINAVRDLAKEKEKEREKERELEKERERERERDREKERELEKEREREKEREKELSTQVKPPLTQSTTTKTGVGAFPQQPNYPYYPNMNQMGNMPQYPQDNSNFMMNNPYMMMNPWLMNMYMNNMQNDGERKTGDPNQTGNTNYGVPNMNMMLYYQMMSQMNQNYQNMYGGSGMNMNSEEGGMKKPNNNGMYYNN